MARKTSEFSPTPSALMELREERQIVSEGYRFLDEKRLLLASEILRQLDEYRQTKEEFDRSRIAAADALRSAVVRHGLQGLQVHPPESLEEGQLWIRQKPFLGVPLQEAGLDLRTPAPTAALDPSPEARSCAETFREMLSASTKLAAATSNIERLLQDYRRTSRRARALEDVILPELDSALREISSRLEEMDQEEAVRVGFRNPG